MESQAAGIQCESKRMGDSNPKRLWEHDDPATHPTTQPNAETPKVANAPLRGSRKPQAHNPRDNSPTLASRDARIPAAHIGASRVAMRNIKEDIHTYTHAQQQGEDTHIHIHDDNGVEPKSGVRARTPWLRSPPHSERKSPLELAPKIPNPHLRSLRRPTRNPIPHCARLTKLSQRLRAQRTHAQRALCDAHPPQASEIFRLLFTSFCVPEASSEP